MTIDSSSESLSHSNDILYAGDQVDQQDQQYTPFCGRRFKVLRIAGHVLCSMIMAIAYKVLSLACWITFQSDKARMYNDWARNKVRIGLSRPISYLFYGSKIINFAHNSTQIYRKPKNESLSKIELLKEFYGDTFDAMLNRYQSNRVPLDESRLDFYPINRGICMGESLDFISRYMNGEQTFEEISQHFVNGGTHEAQITQIIYTSQDLVQLKEEVSNFDEEIEAKLTELNEKLVALPDKEQIKIEARKTLDRDEKTKFIASKLCERESIVNELIEFKREIDERKARCRAQKDFERILPLARINNLDIELSALIIDEETSSERVPAPFIERIQNLPSGAYLTCLGNGKINEPGGHAIAFIKDAMGQLNIFDPNIATLAMDDDNDLSETLWHLTKTFYNTHGTCTMQVYSCNQYHE